MEKTEKEGKKMSLGRKSYTCVSDLVHCTMHGWNKLLKFIAKAMELIAAELQILPYLRNYRFFNRKVCKCVCEVDN